MLSMTTMVVNLNGSTQNLISLAIQVGTVGRNHWSLSSWTADAEF